MRNPLTEALGPQRCPGNMSVPLFGATSCACLPPATSRTSPLWMAGNVLDSLWFPDYRPRLCRAGSQVPACSPHLLPLQVLIAVGTGRAQPGEQVGFADGDQLSVGDKSRARAVGGAVASGGLQLPPPPGRPPHRRKEVQTWSPTLTRQKHPRHRATVQGLWGALNNYHKTHKKNIVLIIKVRTRINPRKRTQISDHQGLRQGGWKETA